MYRVIVGIPRSSATCANTVLTEKVSAAVRVITPKLWLLSLASGTPETVFGELPLIVELGVKRPESIAAVVVTTLNVEPGGACAWSEKLKVCDFGLLLS